MYTLNIIRVAEGGDEASLVRRNRLNLPASTRHNCQTGPGRVTPHTSHLTPHTYLTLPRGHTVTVGAGTLSN